MSLSSAQSPVLQSAPAREEADLIRQALGGSAEAFSELIRAHQAAVRWYLVRALRNWDSADDLAQEVFLSLYRQLGDYRGQSSLRTWLLGIARNLAMEHLRSETRRLERQSSALVARLVDWHVDRLADSSIDDHEYERTFVALRQCIASLPPQTRQAVEEHYLAGQTIADIAQRQGRNSGAVRMMLMRVRNSLAECIRSRAPAEM